MISQKILCPTRKSSPISMVAAEEFILLAYSCRLLSSQFERNVKGVVENGFRASVCKFIFAWLRSTECWMVSRWVLNELTSGSLTVTNYKYYIKIEEETATAKMKAQRLNINAEACTARTYPLDIHLHRNHFSFHYHQKANDFFP